MNKAILGKKLGMTQVFSDDGTVIPVTVLEAGPCFVSQVKTDEKDGYSAVQFAFCDTKEKLVTKPVEGHLKAAGLGAKKYFKEFRPARFQRTRPRLPGKRLRRHLVSQASPRTKPRR